MAVQNEIEVKVEKMNETLHDVREDLEDAQELTGNLVLSENNKMTEIDRLKAELRIKQARIDELERDL